MDGEKSVLKFELDSTRLEESSEECDSGEEGKGQREKSETEEQVVKDESEEERSNDVVMEGTVAQLSDESLDEPFSSDDALRNKTYFPVTL